MASPVVNRRFVHVRDLTEAGGTMNAGISVMLDTTTGRQAIRKRVDRKLRDALTEQEVASLRQLAGHPNINQMYEFVPATAPGSEQFTTDELFLEYCNVPISQGAILETLTDLENLYKSRSATPPEAFVWHFLESMLKALSYMQFGVKDADADADATPIPDWDAVLHNAQLQRLCVRRRHHQRPRVSPHRDHADPQAFCLGTCAQDVDQIFELVVDLSRLSNTRDWPYSEELLSMASRCGEVRDLSLELLELLKACSEEKQKLEAAGKLEFVPLLE